MPISSNSGLPWPDPTAAPAHAGALLLPGNRTSLAHVVRFARGWARWGPWRAGAGAQPLGARDPREKWGRQPGTPELVKIALFSPFSPPTYPQHPFWALLFPGLFLAPPVGPLCVWANPAEHQKTLSNACLGGSVPPFVHDLVRDSVPGDGPTQTITQTIARNPGRTVLRE